MKQDLCDHCEKPVNIHDDGVIHGWIRLVENNGKRKAGVAGSGWWRGLCGGQTQSGGYLEEEGVWCDSQCLHKWIDAHLFGAPLERDKTHSH